MSLPVNLVPTGLALAKDATIYGVKFVDLTREELIAVAILGWKAYSDQLQEVARRRTVFDKLHKRGTIGL